MYSENCSEQVCLFVKLRLVSALFLLVIFLPYRKYQDHKAGTAYLDSFSQKISKGPQQNQSEIPFYEFLQVLNTNTYSGTWLSSIKESKLLKQQNGTVQFRTKEKPSQTSTSEYTILIKIYDGGYRDNGNYQIQLDSSSIKTQQQFLENQLIYQTLSPVIALYRSEHIFMSQKQKPIYINKLKFRLNFDQELKIQLLVAAEYEINIITESLEHNWAYFNQIVFSLIILIQVGIQAYGTYSLLLEVDEQTLIANSVSPTFLKLGISYDTAEFFILCYLVFYENMKILSIPTYFLLMHIIFLETYVSDKVTSSSNHQTAVNINVHHEIQQNQTQIAAESSDNFQNQLPVSGFLQNSTLKSLMVTLQRNQNYLTLFCSYIVFYLNNMHNCIYIVFFLIFMLPQITRNCRIGNKVNYQFQSIITHAYPRLIPILYIRGFGKFGLFLLQPRYVFCLMIILFAVASSAVLFIQKKHGARSILPKFLIPKGLKTKFKFFAIQDQNTTCIVCQSQLSQIPAELKGKCQTFGMKQQITYNKVVLTPCHHKFHAHCLQKWMESRSQCPSCHYSLPPTDSY